MARNSLLAPKGRRRQTAGPDTSNGGLAALLPATKKQKTGSALTSPAAPKTRFAGPLYAESALETWVQVGTCASALGMVPAAVKAFESAVHHGPDSLEALCGLLAQLRASDVSANETAGSQNAVERLSRALEQHPALMKQHRIFKELAECYLLLGLNDHAHQAVQTALALAPETAVLWLLLAQTLIRAGVRMHATGALTQCLLILPDSLAQFTRDDVETARTAHAELAAIAAADGNIELLIAELTATLLLPPPPLPRIDEHIALWCALATAKERANDIASALSACEGAEAAVGFLPRILMTHAYLLLVNNDAQRADTAADMLRQVIAAEAPSGTEPAPEGDFLPWYLLGKAYSLLDQPRAAYDSFQVALRRAPNVPITWLAVGRLYLELKQLPDALAAYSQALRLQFDESSPGTATAWDGLSCVYERCSDQLTDAADACSRSATCFHAIGDATRAQFFEARAQQLMLSLKKEAQVPALRDPPDVPSYLLRDLVALLPSERIAFVLGPQGAKDAKLGQGSPQQPKAQPPPPHPASGTAPPVAQFANPQQPQQQPQLLPPVPVSLHTPAHAMHAPQQGAQRTSQQYYYAAGAPQYPPNGDMKSPRQQLPPPAWSPGGHSQHLPVPPPQCLYQPQHGHPGAPPDSMLPPRDRLGVHSASLRLPMTNPQHVMPAPNGYALAPQGPPPPGYAYGQYVPMQGGMVAHIQLFAPAPVNNWRR